MAKEFTTSFQYKEKTYNATISQVDGSIGIFIPNTDLHHLIPGGKAIYSIDEGLELSYPQLMESQSLMVAILTSIEEHNLQNNPTGINKEKEVE